MLRRLNGLRLRRVVHRWRRVTTLHESLNPSFGFTANFFCSHNIELTDRLRQLCSRDRFDESTVVLAMTAAAQTVLELSIVSRLSASRSELRATSCDPRSRKLFAT